MKRLFFLAIIFSSLNAFSQEKLIGIQGGISSTNISKQRFDNPTDRRNGINLGVSYENLLNKHFSFGVDANYGQRGFILPVFFTDNNGDATGEGYSILYAYDYLSLPVKVGVRHGKQLYGFGNIGISSSIILESEVIIPTYNVGTIIYEGESGIITEQVRRFDVAALVEIGGGYKVNKIFRIFGMASFQHSVTPFNTRFHFGTSNLWHYGFNFSVGAKYALTKKAVKP